MRLSELMSGAGLSGYAVVALPIFFVVFAAIVAWAFLRPQKTIERIARLPLADESRADAGSRERESFSGGRTHG